MSLYYSGDHHSYEPQTLNYIICCSILRFIFEIYGMVMVDYY